MGEIIIDGTGNSYPLKVNADGSINTNSAMARIHIGSGTATYRASAEPGANTASGVWQMSRTNRESFQGIAKAAVTTWASGTGSFDKIVDALFTSPYL